MAQYTYGTSVVEMFRKLQDLSPIYRYVGDPSLLSAIDHVGGINGQEILDFGCGLGMYSQMFLELGAHFVLGTDISDQCIEIAEQKNQDNPQVEFKVRDCGDPNLNLGREFDLAVSINVFHYAKTEKDLQQFAINLFKHVRPGGSIVLSLLNGRPNWLYDYADQGKKYMFNLRKPSPNAQDSDRCTFDIVFDGERVLSVPYFHYSTDTYERAVLNAGFTGLLWSNWEVSQEGRSSFPEGFWKEFDDAQPCVILSATKP